MKRRKTLADVLVTEAGLKADIAYLEHRIEELRAAGGQQYIPGLALVTAMVSCVHNAGRPIPFVEAALSAKEEIEATS